MRALSAHLEAAYLQRLFTGDYRWNGRVTVQPDWWLTAAFTGTGAWPTDKLPIRWWQDAADDQTEIELPNVTTIEDDRTLDQPAASVTITLVNTKIDPPGVNSENPGEIPLEWGHPGWLTFDRGSSPESRARWRHQLNEWNNVLVPNALLRCYKGSGGLDKTLDQAKADGNVMLDGVWMVDKVRVGTDGRLIITARDPIKLLIEQQLYVPLVPLAQYPLSYKRWVISNDTISAAAQQSNTMQSLGSPGNRAVTYSTSSSDAWYGFDAPIHGHYPHEALDGNTDTFWLSVGNSSADAPWATDYYEVDVGGQAINAVYVNPYQGDYFMYVSVMEDGRWQGDPNNPIPYSPPPPPNDPFGVVDTGANIPFVTTDTVPWETPGTYVLDRAYRAQKLRVTFRNEAATQWGPWYFRAGIREIAAQVATTGPDGQAISTTVQPIFYAADAIQNPAFSGAAGYLTVSTFGQQDAFGDARVWPQSGGNGPCNHEIDSVALTATGDGYWVLCDHGHVTSYGAAVYYGDPFLVSTNFYDHGFENTTDKTAVIIRTHTGLGYWTIMWDGTIFNYGDAPQYPNFTPAAHEFISGAANHPTAYGIFAVATNGVVHVRGAAVNHGNYTASAVSNTNQVEIAEDIDCTSTANGYWILTSAGHVQAFGDAPNAGQPFQLTQSPSSYQRYFQIVPTSDDTGYWLVYGNGQITPFGPDTLDFGSPIPGTQGQLRSDGNYRDLSDIPRDLLLYSGFWFKEDLGAGDVPSVFGAIESSGTYSNSDLPPDLFDKRPVIDAIIAIRDMLGFVFYGRADGGACFSSPNWWSAGNFDEDGHHIDVIPEIDERVQLVQYGAEVTDALARSEIIVTSTKVDPHVRSTEWVSYIPPQAKLLRGMVKPVMYLNGFYRNQSEELITAELISLHAWFQSRQGSTTVAVHDLRLELNDQIRIFERVSSETNIHWVRGIHTVLDNEHGTFSATYTTNWLGSSTNWVITKDNPDISGTGSIDPGPTIAPLPTTFPISDNLTSYLGFTQQDRTTVTSNPPGGGIIGGTFGGSGSFGGGGVIGSGSGGTTTGTGSGPTSPPVSGDTVGQLAADLGFPNLVTAVSDEFDGAVGTKPSSTRWDFHQFTTGSGTYWNGNSNISLDGQGHLDIEAVKQPSGIWFSGEMVSKIAYSGARFIVARAKVPGGHGSWPAPIWEWDYPFGSGGVELDVCEQLGMEPTSYHTTVHARTGNPQVSFRDDVAVTLADGFHDYGAAVYNDHVDFYFDGTKIRTITSTQLGSWEFNSTSRALLIDLDMGGWGGTIDATLTTQHLLVDFIRVYQA